VGGERSDERDFPGGEQSIGTAKALLASSDGAIEALGVIDRGAIVNLSQELTGPAISNELG
jgi:hypothetical protein